MFDKCWMLSLIFTFSESTLWVIVCNEVAILVWRSEIPWTSRCSVAHALLLLATSLTSAWICLSRVITLFSRICRWTISLASKLFKTVVLLEGPDEEFSELLPVSVYMFTVSISPRTAAMAINAVVCIDEICLTMQADGGLVLCRLTLCDTGVWSCMVQVGIIYSDKFVTFHLIKEFYTNPKAMFLPKWIWRQLILFIRLGLLDFFCEYQIRSLRELNCLISCTYTLNN